ncbi:AAA domain-containing protein [Streptomyces sp. NPDC058867]|uniref:AAA domain-containing protein n=1 Tax=unclassified Streptomyces TaxID=2593676 RepID=UPI0036ACC26A
MLTRTVALPGPVVLVPTDSVDAEFSRLHRTRTRLPHSVEDLTGEFRERGAVPAVFDDRRGRRRLLVYGRGFLAVLDPDTGPGTRPGTGTGTPSGARPGAGSSRCYRVIDVRPLHFKDHHTLAQGCLLLKPTAWIPRYTSRALPEDADAHWETLTEQWEALRKEVARRKGASPPDESEQRLLGTLQRVVDKEFALQRDQVAAAAPFVYRAVSPAAERRLTSRSVYVFDLHGRGAPVPDEVVQVRGRPQLRGQVVAVGPDARVTVAFDRAVDWALLPQQGELERVANSTVHKRRSEALGALREGTARNPMLLSVLAGTRAPRTGRARGNPVEPLDDWQRAAFGTALATEDLSVVIGPPGTGKTRVITEVVRAVAREEGRAGRVLVTAHSNAAVDNVLGRLGEDLLVVRVGHEGRVSEAARPYLLHTRATTLRQGILDRVGARLGDHDDGRAAEWVRALDDSLERLASAVRDREAARAAHRTAIRAVAGPEQGRVDRLAERLTRARRRQARLTRRHAALTDRRNRCRDARGRPVIVPGRLRLWWWTRLLTRTTTALETQKGVTVRADAARRAAQEALEAATRDDPAVRPRCEALRAADEECRALREDAFNRARHCRRLLAPVAAGPPLVEPVPDGPEPPDDRPLAEFARWARQAAPLLGARRELLAQWHDDVSAATDQLHAELIRYAHVVGATSTGAAGPALLTGVEFDLAVVDEAGQITTADALVPLVRARRGLLVGDHRQLPPFQDDGVLRWARTQRGPEAAELVGTSVLERVQGRLPGHAVACLWEQRRMPREVADFCSRAFYEGRLVTPARRRPVRSRLFRSPLVLIDTSDLPIGDRGESPPPRTADGTRGWVNAREAELLAHLAEDYAEHEEEWAVIVPYRAQAALVRSRLSPPTAGRGDVATVDSFQGGERDVVLYGFTRSNSYGEVGFLDELRRANVAFTRARQQLVLVGDLDTLTRAADPAFRGLARALRQHVAEQGRIVPSRDLGTFLPRARVLEAGR